MKTKIMVSIIIPLYNTPKDYFESCLNSIKEQGFNSKTMEVIIIDDCSTEDYSEIFLNYQDLNLIILKPEQNSGPGVCRHMGVNKAQGKYITFVDADDIFSDSTALSRLLTAAINNPQMDIICGQTIEELKDGTKYTHLNTYIWCFAKLYKKDFLNKYNINFNDTRANEDNSFCTLCSLCTDKILWIEEPVYFWRFQPESITRINNQDYKYKGFKSYVENMIWVYDECIKRGIQNKNNSIHHCIAVWIRLYFHFIDVFQNKGEKDAIEILKLARQFYEKTYIKVENKFTDRKFYEIYRSMAESSLIEFMLTIINISFPEFEYRVKNKDYSNFNERFNYYLK